MAFNENRVRREERKELNRTAETQLDVAKGFADVASKGAGASLIIAAAAPVVAPSLGMK